MLRKTFIVITIVFLLIPFYPVPGQALTEPIVEAPSALLLELRRGQVLYSKNPDEPLHIAAASKLMTVFIAIERTDAKTMVTASKEAVNAEGAMLDLTVGEKYTAESLIYASMLNNANDATIALAEAVGGTVEGFVKMMNDYAAAINMSNTVFMNPTGTYDERQRTTATDMARLLRHALTTSSVFERTFSSQAKPWFDKEKTIVLTNHNEMFWSYEGVDGGKTDYHDPKRQSVITTVTRRQQRLLCILLDAPPENMYNDTMKLFDHGFSNFMRGPLVSKGQPLYDVSLQGHTISLLAGSDVFYTFPVGISYIQQMDIAIVESNLRTPLYRNTLLGTAKFTLTDGTIIAVDLFPDREILPEMTRYEKIRLRLLEYREIMYIIFGLAAIQVILLLYRILKWLTGHVSIIMKKRS